MSLLWVGYSPDRTLGACRERRKTPHEKPTDAYQRPVDRYIPTTLPWTHMGHIT
eukprot:CAMPEP_0180827252 /NCGR_PEP_ID=MMETSP1038_2-20121128/74062_1 /TAXON_ID=632150 /ORGANISM="Azadinium spinosum, Strain 3D9" /LENGTH=53 /DNA_ID=CAMNT_0022870083 /DNA_START=56 /DNA_END=213 /DNA_ORIENTATION=+